MNLAVLVPLLRQQTKAYRFRPLFDDETTMPYGGNMKRWNTRVFTLLATSFICLLTEVASAQSFPRLKPIPSRRSPAPAAKMASDARPLWQALTNQAPTSNGVQIMIQGTDGSILVQAFDGQTWMRLTPDSKGSYLNGTWTTLASEPTPRIYFASQIMPDGRLFVVGGEYSGPALIPDWSNTGEIYDPLSNTWTPITPYPSQAGCPYLNYVSGNTTRGSVHITGVYPYTSGLSVGEGIFGFGIPNSATIVSVDSPAQVTISAAA